VGRAGGFVFATAGASARVTGTGGAGLFAQAGPGASVGQRGGQGAGLAQEVSAVPLPAGLPLLLLGLGALGVAARRRGRSS
jgi:hypothetical protein